MRLLKLVVAALILLIIIAIVAIGILIFFVDPNQLKPTLTSEVLRQTGYQLSIDGKLSWSFYPRLGIKAERMTMTNPGQISPFLSLRDVRVATPLAKFLSIRNQLSSTVYIAELQFAKLRFQNLNFNLNWQNNLLNIGPINALFYNGSLNGVVRARNLRALPNWEWNVQTDKVELQSLLQDLNPNHKIKISGLAKINLQGNTLGKNNTQLIKNLNGNGKLIVDQGVLYGTDLNYFVKSAKALLNKKPLPPSPQNKQTSFQQMTSTILIKNGVINTPDILLVSNQFSTKATGSINLLDETLNYQAQIMSFQSTQFKWAIPILISGSLNNPTVRLDTLGIYATITQEQFEQVKTKIQKEIKKIPGKVDRLLKRIMDN